MTNNFIEEYYRRAIQSPYTQDQLLARTDSEEVIKYYQSIRDILNDLLKKAVDRWKDVYPGAISVDIRNIVALYAAKNLKRLDELPSDFDKFIVFCLMDYFSILYEANKPGWLPQSILSSYNEESPDNFTVAFERYVKHRANLEAMLIGIFPFISEYLLLRDPKLKQLSIKHFLDVYNDVEKNNAA